MVLEFVKEFFELFYCVEIVFDVRIEGKMYKFFLELDEVVRDIVEVIVDLVIWFFEWIMEKKEWNLILISYELVSDVIDFVKVLLERFYGVVIELEEEVILSL